MKIYDKKDVLILDVEPDDSSDAEDRIHQTKLLTLYYSLPEYVEIPEGAYTDFRGTRYRLESAQKFICHGDRNFEYTVTMEGPEAALRKYKVRDTTIQNLLKFAYTAKPRAHLELIVKALRVAGIAAGRWAAALRRRKRRFHTATPPAPMPCKCWPMSSKRNGRSGAKPSTCAAWNTTRPTRCACVTGAIAG